MSAATTKTGQPKSAFVRRNLWRPRTSFQNWSEWLIEKSLLACGILSIIITIAIAYVVFEGSIEFFQSPNVTFLHFFTGLETIPKPDTDDALQQLAQRYRVVHESATHVTIFNPEWSAGFFNEPKYCILPLLSGTFTVAIVAALVALPIGLLTAIYLSEYATPKFRAIAKPTLELLAGIPTVVYGFFAVVTLTPWLVDYLPGLEAPYNQLSGGIVVGIMIIPLVASMSEDALRAVPRSLRDGSYALGATKFETSLRVVVPAALSGILASFVLAISRAVGETMAVSLACGDRPKLSFDPREGVATMTAFIVRIAKGDVVHGSTDFNSLFAVACTLFVMTLLMNVFSQWIMRRYRQVYQ